MYVPALADRTEACRDRLRRTIPAQPTIHGLVRVSPLVTGRSELIWKIEFAVLLLATGQLIGFGGLFDISRAMAATLFVGIGERDHWGQGHGTEATSLMVRYAFETLNLNRVWLHVYEYNRRGIRAYEKAGFRREGLLRQDTFRDGRYWDTVVMAVLRDEWQAPRQPRPENPSLTPSPRP